MESTTISQDVATDAELDALVATLIQQDRRLSGRAKHHGYDAAKRIIEQAVRPQSQADWTRRDRYVDRYCLGVKL